MTRGLALVALFALATPSWWSETNSHAANRRGIEAWERQQYAAAADSFREGAKAVPSPRNAYSLGTAEIAAGDVKSGTAHLAEAMNDPSLRADGHFNRGNAALAAREPQRAIPDYVEALKANPGHAGAKRNLEIALTQSQAAQRKQESGDPGDTGESEQPQQPSPDESKQQQPEGEVDLEALLRSVLQQEEEELRRMKGRAGERPVGW
ncbi:MAG TPA: tetratricopeptide repeat protein [Thermoanaerobaculia bacterium]